MAALIALIAFSALNLRMVERSSAAGHWMTHRSGASWVGAKGTFKELGCLTWEVFGFRNLRDGCVPRTRRGPTWFNGRTQPSEDQRERHGRSREVTKIEGDRTPQGSAVLTSSRSLTFPNLSPDQVKCESECTPRR